MKRNPVVEVIVIVLVLTVPFALRFAVPTLAYATEGSGILSVGEAVSFQGATTNDMSFEGRPAFCLQAPERTPETGTYSWTSDTGAAEQDVFARILSRGWGGPSFSETDPLWPSEAQDSLPLERAGYQNLTHYLLSAAWLGSVDQALGNLAGTDRDWYKDAVSAGIETLRSDEDSSDVTPVLIKTPEGMQPCASWIDAESEAVQESIPVATGMKADTEPETGDSEQAADKPSDAKPLESQGIAGVGATGVVFAYFPFTLYRTGISRAHRKISDLIARRSVMS